MGGAVMYRVLFLVFLLFTAPGYAAVEYFFQVSSTYFYDDGGILSPADDASVRERFADFRVRLEHPEAGGSVSYYKDHETERLIEDGMSFSFGEAWGGIFETCAPLVTIEDDFGNPVEVRESPCRFEATLRDFGAGLEGYFDFTNEPLYSADGVSYRSDIGNSFMWDVFFDGPGAAPGTRLYLVVVAGEWVRASELPLPGTLNLVLLGVALLLGGAVRNSKRPSEGLC